MVKRLKITKVYIVKLSKVDNTELERFLFQKIEHDESGNSKNYFQYDNKGKEVICSIMIDNEYITQKDCEKEIVVIKEEIFDSEGKLVEWTEINNNGDEEKYIRQNKEQKHFKNDKLHSINEYVYDELGRHTKTIEKNADGKITEELIMIRDESSERVKEMIIKDELGEWISKSTYDQNGYEIKRVHYNEKNEIELSEQYEYDNKRRKTKLIGVKDETVVEKSYLYSVDSDLLVEETVLKKVNDHIIGSYKKIFEYEFWENITE